MAASGMPYAPAGAFGSERAGALCDRIISLRVGGQFWGRAVEIDGARRVWLALRHLPGAVDRVSDAIARFAPDALFVSLPGGRGSRPMAGRLERLGVSVCVGAPDPWSVLPRVDHVIADGDDPVAFLGLLAGRHVICVSDGPIAGWGLTEDHADLRRKGEKSLDALTAQLVVDGHSYHDPFTGARSTPEAFVELLGFWRGEIDRNRPIVAGCGIAQWKRTALGAMLWSGQSRGPTFRRAWRPAVAQAVRERGVVIGWPSRVPQGFGEGAAASGVPVWSVEDGFIRSAGLGSDCCPPCSVTVDSQRMHYDPAGPSDLEDLLNHAAFAPELLARAARLTDRIRESGIGKYSQGGEPLSFPSGGRRRVIVPGQVEDDLSVVHGGAQISGNLDLLRRVRGVEPNSYIIYRPHPDVEAGHRKGRIEDREALLFADRIERKSTMAACLRAVDAVHVITSLTGFEALIQGIEVVTHGRPFYAGWGLTRDLAGPLDRRRRRLSLAELVAATLILYPRYLDPVTALPCPPEVLIERFAGGYRPRHNWLTALRRLRRHLPQSLQLA